MFITRTRKDKIMLLYIFAIAAFVAGIFGFLSKKQDAAILASSTPSPEDTLRCAEETEAPKNPRPSLFIGCGIFE